MRYFVEADEDPVPVQIWNETEDRVPTREEISRRVVFVENKHGDIQSTKVHPSDWASCGYNRWTFADDYLMSEQMRNN